MERGFQRGSFRGRRPHPYNRGRGRVFRGRGQQPFHSAPPKIPESGAQEIDQVSTSCSFQAGRLKEYIENWRKITNDETVLDIVQTLSH